MSVADPRAFRSGRNFSAWIGLVPKQHSSGGKDRLGSISKQGTAICAACSSPAPSLSFVMPRSVRAALPSESIRITPENQFQDAIGRPHRVGSQCRERYPRAANFLSTLSGRPLAWDRLGLELRRKAGARGDTGWERSAGTLIRRPPGRTT